MSESTQESANVPATRQMFAPEDLRAIASFEDAKRLLMEQGVEMRDASHEIGDGFVMLENKDDLVNKPLIILAWMFTDGDFGDKYSILRLVTADGRKLVVTDGGTGIKAQLQEYTERTGIQQGLFVERGLRKSEYDTDVNGQPTQDKTLATGRGCTYYLNV